MSIRIGFVGAGAIAAYHRRSLQSAGYGVHAVYDPDLERAQSLGAHVCSSLDEVIDRSDAVWILTPTRAHLKTVQRAAGAGRAVFCEKPLGVNLKDAQAVRDAASVVPNQVGLVLRSRGAYRRLAELAIEPTAVVARVDMPGLDAMRTSWRGDVHLAGGGILIELAFHDVDLLLWAMGSVASVACTTHGGAIEDAVSLSLQFASGATGSLTAVWHNAAARGFQRSIEVFSDRQWIRAVDAQLQWVDESGEGTFDGGASLNPDADFIEAIESGRQPAPSVDDALAVHRVIDAAYRSAATGGAAVAVG